VTLGVLLNPAVAAAGDWLYANGNGSHSRHRGSGSSGGYAWKQPTSWSSDATSVLYQQDRLYLLQDGEIRAFSVRTGAGLWSLKSPQTAGLPLRWEAMIAGAFLVAKYSGTADVDGDLFFIDQATGKLGSRVKLGKWCSPPVLASDLFSVVVREDDTYAMVRLAVSTGSRVSTAPLRIGVAETHTWPNWDSYHFRPEHTGITSSGICFASDHASLVLLRVLPAEVVGLRYTRYPVSSPPIAVGNTLIQASMLADGSLGAQALNVAGRVVWTTTLPYAYGGVFSTGPTGAGQRLVFFDGGTAFALSATSGKRLWTSRVAKGYSACRIGPVSTAEDVYVVATGATDRSDSIVRLNLRTGRVLRRYQLPGSVTVLAPHGSGLIVGYNVQRGSVSSGELALIK
jgi:hypothetical protein